MKNVEQESNNTQVEENAVENSQANTNDYDNFFSVERQWEESSSPVISLNNKIVLQSDESTVIYQADSFITSFVANADLAFFQVEDTIYRLHISSGTVDELYSSDIAFRIFPISNTNILIQEYTPEAIAHMNAGGQVFDPDVDINWNTAIVLDTSTQTITLVPTNDEIMFYTGTTVSNFSGTINGKDIPHVSYTSGAKGANWSGASTCVAHAKFIYNYIWGSESYGTAYYNEPFTSDSFKTKINALKVGARITIYPKVGGSAHTFILVAKGESDFTVYHSNWGNANLVSFTKFTHSEITGAYGSMSYLKP